MSGLPVFLFLDVSGGELLVILFVVFLVFGPEKMPEMARKAGRLMNQMKKATNDLTNEFKKETSVLQNEIKNVHKQVNEEVESVSREINRTKAQVVNDLKIEPISMDSAVNEKPADLSPSGGQGKVDPAEPSINPIVSE